MTVTWDPTRYGQFSSERSRPFVDLMARVDAREPGLVVDLGCGNGPLTLSLAERWPQARVVGVDSSVEMLDAARALDTDGRVEWVEADLADWDIASLGAAPDVVVTCIRAGPVRHHATRPGRSGREPRATRSARGDQ